MQLDAIRQILPECIKSAFLKGNVSIEAFEEIRIRTDRPVSLRKGTDLLYLNPDGSLTKSVSQAIILTREEMEHILLNASRFSVYAAEEQISQGYLTLPGGNRIGICGEVIMRSGRIQGIRRISSYNIRIAREVRGCAEMLYPWLWERGVFLDTLIVSPPGLGKTTLLRDLIRLISDGDARHSPLTVGLADERGEVAACINGAPQNDIGKNTDVMDGGSKTDTMPMLLRTMAPQVLAADEAGGEADVRIFEQAKKWGTALLTTAHGTIRQHIFENSISKVLFSRYIAIEIDDENTRRFRIYDKDQELLMTSGAERSRI